MMKTTAFTGTRLKTQLNLVDGDQPTYITEAMHDGAKFRNGKIYKVLLFCNLLILWGRAKWLTASYVLLHICCNVGTALFLLGAHMKSIQNHMGRSTEGIGQKFTRMCLKEQ